MDFYERNKTTDELLIIMTNKTMFSLMTNFERRFPEIW